MRIENIWQRKGWTGEDHLLTAEDDLRDLIGQEYNTFREIRAVVDEIRERHGRPDRTVPVAITVDGETEDI